MQSESVIREIADTHAAYIEAMAAAYLKLTNIPPDKVALCQQMGQDGVFRFWFEPRDEVERRQTYIPPLAAYMPRLEGIPWQK